MQCNNTTQYNTIRYDTMQCNTVQYNTIGYDAMQCNTVQWDGGGRDDDANNGTAC